MPASPHFHELLFELSNEVRYSILHKLKLLDYNVTNIAKELSITTQESSRHLNRLAEHGLIEKTITGEYTLTEYGLLILRQSEGLIFTSSNRDYYKTHKIPVLPTQFVSRLPELEESRQITDVMLVFALIERIIDEANEYIWRLTDRYNMMSLPKLEKATDRGIEFRLMQTKHFQFPPNWPGVGVILKDARLRGVFDVRTSYEANLFIAMNEREVAVLGFPMDENVFDYRGFSSSDPDFHAWCCDLFEYYWVDAIPVN
jgi:predicted transcriptional regulator